MKVGVALNPHTSIVLLDDILEDIDLVCLMSVNPGFGGQMFIENTLYKISKLKNRILQRNLHTLIEIDGGVTFENASTILKEGADVLVAGNTVFKSSNPIAAIEKLKSVSIK
jgi:ribulose-phosphate 3-epimerase